MVAAPISRTLKPTWTIPIALLIGATGFIVNMALLFVVTARVKQSSMGMQLGPFQRSTISTLISLLATCALIAPIAVIIARRRGPGRWWDSLEWYPNRAIGWSSVLGAVAAVLFQLVFRLAVGSAGSFGEYPLALSFTLYIFSSVLLQSLIEEVYFRGILFIALAKRLGETPAIVVVTLIFAWMHPLHRLTLLPIAILLGLIRLKTRSVACCFAFHASYNLFIVLYLVIAPS
jgi:membrane protease YdiL (CAAX protease family)